MRKAIGVALVWLVAGVIAGAAHSAIVSIEPATFALFGLGLAGLAGLGTVAWRRKSPIFMNRHEPGDDA